MQRLLPLASIVLLSLLPSFAQNDQSPPASSEVGLRFEIEGNSRQFHLGELIPVKWSYTAQTPGIYVWVSQSGKLAEGRPLEISCSPAAESVSKATRSVDATTFDQTLIAPCGGVAGGGGGGCVDCDGEQPLTTTPLSFGFVPLNMYVRFRTPGKYACDASSADVTASGQDEKIRPALLVKSNSIELTILNDPAWAHSAAISYAGAYEKLCSGDVIAEGHLLQCFDVAQRITYIDTADSLATEVKWFDGRSHGWDNGFWDAIQRSSQPDEALRLMTSRMQEPDFQVSDWVMQWLTSSDLKLEVPDAFQGGSPATYHALAVEKLRKYVRLLGSSLSKKNPTVLAENIKTYRKFADQRYCEEEPLIPEDELNGVLAGLE